MKHALLLILLIVVVAACSPIATPNITTDMNAFLSQKGLSSTDLKCYMLGNGVTPGPEAMCFLTLDETNVTSMVNTLALKTNTDSFVSVSWRLTGPDCWTRLKFHDQTVSNWYVSPDDNPNLQLPNGMHWLYFRLFYVQDKSEACISVSYSS